MKKRYYIVLILFVLMQMASGNIWADNVQPKIMVIPKVMEGEDIRTVLEQDATKRVILVKIKEAFDNEGATTVDFLTKLKAVSQLSAFNDNDQRDTKSQLIEMSGADIYIEAEIVYQESASGNSVRITMEANDIATGNSLSNKVADSGKFYTDDWGKLASKAIDTKAAEFLNTIQAKFSEILEKGQAIAVNFSFDSGSAYTMDTEVGDDMLPLSDALTEFMDTHAYNGNYHVQGITSTQMMFDEVRIPLKDPKNGTNYSANKFATEIFRWMRSNNIPVKRDVKGSAIYIHIQ